jgi:AcrR family transcriptional regulator
MVARAEAAQATADRTVQAALELFTDRPFDDVSLDEVAARAGVAKRTVLRRFRAKDELFAAAMDHAVERMTAERDEAPVGDVAGAVANVVDHYERWGDNRLRLLSQEDRIPVVAENVKGGRRFHREWVERTFAPLIGTRRGAARTRRVAALIALTDVFTWKLLRRDLGLSREDVERTLVDLIRAMEREP